MRKIVPQVYEVGSIDWDREIFDELIPLPNGTSYNAYLIKGSEKTALIDTVDPAKKDELFLHLKDLQVEKIDYIIANHAEQDHSGSIPAVLEAYPGSVVVTNAKCKDFLQDLLLIPEEKFKVVEEGEKLSLGDKTLTFVLTPWTHWPETMGTFLIEDKIYFSCDFFGAHLAASELFISNPQNLILGPAKRYYAEIMMPFRAPIRKNLEKVKELAPKIIAPSHGPLHNQPQVIMDAYADWASDKVKNEAVLPFLSMHDSTRTMANYLIEAFIDKGITVKPFNITKADTGDIAMALVDAATLVLAAPTALVGPHPKAVYIAYLANALRPKTKYLGIVGSFGWGSKMLDTLKGMITNLNAELLEPVIVKGYPKEADFKALDKLVETIAAKHAAL